MASFGAQYAVIGKATDSENTYPTISEGTVLGQVESFEDSLSSSTTTYECDNQTVEQMDIAGDTSLKYVLNYLTAAVKTMLYGPPDEGYGYGFGAPTNYGTFSTAVIQDVSENNVRKATVFYYPLCTPKTPDARSGSTKTKGNVTYKGREVNFTLAPAYDGNYVREIQFDTVAAAKTWINEKFGISAAQ